MASLCGRLTKQISSESESEFELGKARVFSFRSLQDATNNFSGHNLIGFGGSASYHRGVLPNGTLIAVKKYRGDFFSFDEFLTTMEIRHPNIIRVIGFCLEKSQPLLVHEYMSNGSLNDLLHDKEKRESVFNWPMRVAVCNGIARGLHHLHEEINCRVIHRDIKPANVLFDSNFTPKITGFDIAKFVQEEEEDDGIMGTLGYLDPIVGTLGYLDPEYMVTGKCTPKSDVFGFGVVMLQIISGRKAIFQSQNSDDDRESLSSWALDLLAKDRVLEVVDPVLADFPVDQVLGFIDVALSCVNEESKLRPSMGEVIQKMNRVCNSPFTPFEMQQPDTPYVSAASSFRSSTEQTYDEIEGESIFFDQKKEEVFERPTVRQGEYAAYNRLEQKKLCPYARKKNMMPRNKA